MEIGVRVCGAYERSCRIFLCPPPHPSLKFLTNWRLQSNVSEHVPVCWAAKPEGILFTVETKDCSPSEMPAGPRVLFRLYNCSWNTTQNTHKNLKCSHKSWRWTQKSVCVWSSKILSEKVGAWAQKKSPSRRVHPASWIFP